MAFHRPPTPSVISEIPFGPLAFTWQRYDSTNFFWSKLSRGTGSHLFVILAKTSLNIYLCNLSWISVMLNVCWRWFISFDETILLQISGSIAVSAVHTQNTEFNLDLDVEIWTQSRRYIQKFLTQIVKLKNFWTIWSWS